MNYNMMSIDIYKLYACSWIFASLPPVKWWHGSLIIFAHSQTIVNAFRLIECQRIWQ